MKDMNLAKLTAVDLPLFNGITSDLFPGVEVPQLDYSIVRSSLSSICNYVCSLCCIKHWPHLISVLVKSRVLLYMHCIYGFSSPMHQQCPEPQQHQQQHNASTRTSSDRVIYVTMAFTTINGECSMGGKRITRVFLYWGKNLAVLRQHIWSTWI